MAKFTSDRVGRRGPVALRVAFGVALGAVLAACAGPGASPSTDAARALPQCTAAAPGDALIGNWLSVAAQPGVAGSVRTLIRLEADGSMHFVEQVKRPRTPSQGLQESGCWQHAAGDALVLRTLKSNGVQVDLDDPIYVNRYRVRSVSAQALRLEGGSQGPINARRMAPGYRLPF